MKKYCVLLILIMAILSTGNLHAYYFGMNKVNPVFSGWSMINTMHFDIYYPQGNDEFGRLAALMSEDTYYYLKDDFQFPSMTRIPIVFYGSQLEFQTTNIIYPLLSEGVGGFTESGKNRVAIPFDGSYVKLEQTLTHELTHAYTNALDNGTPGSFFYLKNYNFPFWFSEGLPEYEAIGGTDVSNNSYVLDMVINDKLTSLTNTQGYSAYRLGEAFLNFLRKRYGKDKVMDFFFTVRATNDLNAATKKIFGMEFKDLESRWKNQLKRDYFPFVNSHTIPQEYAEAKTDHQKDGSYFNLAPRFSPDGQRYVYFANPDGRFSIWTGGLFESSKKHKILTGEATGKLEEFHYLRSNLSWFADNNRFAFAAKTSMGDRIYIVDFAKEQIIRQYALPGIAVIFELDVAADGKSCVVSAQKDMQTDLYQYYFDTGELIQLTNDRYMDYQPRFGKDNRIAFASERSVGEMPPRNGYFSDLHSNLFLYNLADQTTSQVTFDEMSCYHPVWDSTGTKLYFLSERDSIANLEQIDLVTNQRAVVSATLSGIYSFDVNFNDQFLIFSGFYNAGWDIYLKTKPLADLVYEPCRAPEPVTFADSLLHRVDLSRLDYYGKRPKRKIHLDDDLLMYRKGTTVFDFNPTPDSLKVKRDYSWDNRPDSILTIPKVKKYKPRYSLDRFWGGFAYNASVGTVGSLEMGMSDIMGNHAIGISMAVSGKLKDSNLLVTYLYLPQRIDYGIGAYNVLDEIIYRQFLPGNDAYFRSLTRETGLYFLVRYPFNRFFRIDFENSIYSWEEHWDEWLWDSNGQDGSWNEDIEPVKRDVVYAPALTFVQDNALYGPTGPLLGLRSYTTLRKSLALDGNDYHTLYSDIRTYSLFSKRYAAAFRFVGGVSGGKQPQSFELDGYYGIRGYDGDAAGRKIAMSTAELRFPFFDYIGMAFPLPITLGGIRGSAFADIGAVWDEDKEFIGLKDDRLYDWKMGIGFGPRMNVGFAVLKLDVAWQTDLVQNSRPSYYFSLTEDF